MAKQYTHPFHSLCALFGQSLLKEGQTTFRLRSSAQPDSGFIEVRMLNGAGRLMFQAHYEKPIRLYQSATISVARPYEEGPYMMEGRFHTLGLAHGADWDKLYDDLAERNSLRDLPWLDVLLKQIIGTPSAKDAFVVDRQQVAA